jgi:hypothetical protein
MAGDYAEQLEQHGFAVVPDAINGPTADWAVRVIESAAGGEATLTRGASAFGIRKLLDVVPALRTLAHGASLRSLVDPVEGGEAAVVRGIFFDKTRDANWKVAWHQDLTIAVRERREVAGFGPWSVKAGLVHVQPPAAVLEHVLTVRLHLDDADETSGALKVVPGSHRHGRLSPAEIRRLKERAGVVTCAVKRGGALLMRPLLLHASSSAARPLHRRVLHLEYSAHKLPGGLEWYGS